MPSRHKSKTKWPLLTLVLTLVFTVFFSIIFLRQRPAINELELGSTLGVFTDLGNVTWAESAIDILYTLGITSGCSSSPLKYCPTDVVTRDQISVFLLKSKYGGTYTPPTMYTNRYSDVPPTHWAATWIEQLSVEGIVGGCATGKFCPSDGVTRAQAAVMLLRTKYGGSYTPPAASGTFTDVPTSHWAASWIEALAKAGITSGCGTNPARFCPDNTLNRAELAVLLVNTFNLRLPTPTPTATPTPTSTAWPTIIPSPSPTLTPIPSPSPSVSPKSLLESFSLTKPCARTGYSSIVYRCTGGVLQVIVNNMCLDGVSGLKKAISSCVNNGATKK